MTPKAIQTRKKNRERKHADMLKRFNELREKPIVVQGHRVRLTIQQAIDIVAWEFYLSPQRTSIIVLG